MSTAYQTQILKKLLLEEKKDADKISPGLKPMDPPASPFRKTISEEHKKKISEAQKKRHEKIKELQNQ